MPVGDDLQLLDDTQVVRQLRLLELRVALSPVVVRSRVIFPVRRPDPMGE